MRTLIGILLLSCHSALALPLIKWQEATVKINSFPCLTESPRFHGSGVLLAIKDQVYVLTSEHVVIQDQSSRTCHTANGDAAELVRADFKSGLALLKVKDSARLLGQAIAITELKSVHSSLDVVALGYPAGSQDLSTLKNGEVLTTQSSRALIAGIPKFIEAFNLPAEYGMSGGILIARNGSDYSFAGILSHQILKREAGLPTRADDVTPGSRSQNDLTLAIPAQAALSWIDFESSRDSEILWQRNPELQVAGKESLQYGPLLFTLKLKKAQDAWDIGGAFSGGSDGSGIGGNDDGQNAKDGESLQTIDVTFVKTANSAQKSQTMSDSKMNQWRLWLLSGKKVSIVALKNPQARSLVRIQSLSQFLTLWMRDNHQPLGIRSKEGNAKNDSDILVAKTREVAKLAQQARDHTTVMDQKAWFAMIRDVALSAEAGLVSSEDILVLLKGENERYWREYYSSEFESAVALESAIQAVIEQLEKMGV